MNAYMAHCVGSRGTSCIHEGKGGRARKRGRKRKYVELAEHALVTLNVNRSTVELFEFTFVWARNHQLSPGTFPIGHRRAHPNMVLLMLADQSRLIHWPIHSLSSASDHHLMPNYC